MLLNWRGNLHFLTCNGNTLLSIAPHKNSTKELPMSQPIVDIIRYSGYVLARHKHSVSFLDIPALSLIHTISHADEIVGVDFDVKTNSRVYVATFNQVYLYDCEAMMAKVTKKSCVFQKRLLSSNLLNGSRLVDFKVVRDALVL